MCLSFHERFKHRSDNIAITLSSSLHRERKKKKKELPFLRDVCSSFTRARARGWKRACFATHTAPLEPRWSTKAADAGGSSSRNAVLERGSIGSRQRSPGETVVVRLPPACSLAPLFPSSLPRFFPSLSLSLSLSPPSFDPSSPLGSLLSASSHGHRFGCTPRVRGCMHLAEDRLRALPVNSRERRVPLERKKEREREREGEGEREGLRAAMWAGWTLLDVRKMAVGCDTHSFSLSLSLSLGLASCPDAFYERLCRFNVIRVVRASRKGSTRVFKHVLMFLMCENTFYFFWRTVNARF